jgi:CubicO group peptidase (beta-lactamase class C family)
LGTEGQSGGTVSGESIGESQFITASPSHGFVQTSTNTYLPTVTETPTAIPYDKIPTKIEDGWEVASLNDTDINPIRISRMLEHIYHGQKRGDTPDLPNGRPKYMNVHSILIVKDRRLVFEEYFYDYGHDDKHDLASITKSITSLLVGAAIEQGHLTSVDEKVLSFFPEYLPLEQPDIQAENMTIEDLLTMRSGWECDDWNPESRTYYQKMQPMEIRTILNFPMETRPGYAFSYCTSGTAVLNAIIAKASEMELSQFANQSILEPLGIQDVTWDYDYSFGGYGGILLMRPRDMARIGLLALQNGLWQEEQIIPQDWIEQSVYKHVGLSFNKTWGNGYGYLWWLSDIRYGETKIHSFSASGHGGQVITIFPDLKMVVVITGGDYYSDDDQSFQIMERFILPAALGY